MTSGRGKKHDRELLLQLTRPKLLNVLEQSWTALTLAYPYGSFEEISRPFRKVIDGWFKSLADSKGVEFTIVMGSVQRQIMDEFLNSKKPLESKA